MCRTFSDCFLLCAKGLREIFFPGRCIVCGVYLSENEKDMCSACLEELPLTYQWDIVQNAAFERLARRFEVQSAASLFFFGTGSDYRRILYGIKYGGRRKLGRSMGFMLGSQLASSRFFSDCQLVVPVPLHPLRRWKRGYNQAEEIARGVAEALGLPLETSLLRRNRFTKTQTRLQGEAKMKNVQGAFSIMAKRSEELRSGGLRHILLVDDVLTTGSTLAACAAPLMSAGFRLSCATLGFAGS